MSKETIDAFVELSTLFSQYFSAKQFNEDLEEFSKLEWYILNFLGDSKNTTQDDLFKLIPTDNITIRRAIRRLGRSKHIHHVDVDGDAGQSNVLELTTKGESVNANMIQIDHTIAEEMIRNITEKQEKEDFQTSINQVLASITS